MTDKTRKPIEDTKELEGVTFTPCLPSPKDDDNRQASNNARKFLAKLGGFCEGVFIKFGPFEVRPGLRQEVPIGRAYQPMPISSVSRLHGFIGRDEHSLYIREVPDQSGLGLKPSKNGIWVKQATETEFRRLEPGQAERIYSDTDVRLGGNGKSGSTGFRLDVY